MICSKRVLIVLLMAVIMNPHIVRCGEVVELEETVVVSSPIIEGNLVDRYGAGKTLITREQIDSLNAQDMTSALRKTPGVNISRYNPVGAFGGGEGGAVYIRGMGSSRPGSEIKTFIDGIPMYMSVWNHPLMDLMSIDAGNAIEVYKSPQPQYFGNAMAGINMTPKRWTGNGKGIKTEVAAGSYGTTVAKAEVGGVKDDLDYFLGGGYRHSDGHRDHSEGETGNVFGRIGYRINSLWDLSLFTLYSDNFAEDPGKEGEDASQRLGTYETRANLVDLTLSNTCDAFHGYVKVYANKGEGDWLDQPTETSGVTEDLFNDFSFYGLKLRETFTMERGTEVVTGFDWEYLEGDYDALYSNGQKETWEGHDMTLVSPYLAVSHGIAVTDSLSLIPSAGIRYYNNSDFGTAWSPHAGLVLDFKGVSCHVGYSRGVVFPGLDVVVFSQEVIPGLGTSWKDLDPEVMDHYEAGIAYASGTFFDAELTWFYNDGKDRYVFVTSPTAKPVYDNVETYVTKGVEASVSLYPTRDLALFFGATLMKTDPCDLPYAPELTLSAGLNWTFLPAFTLNLDAQYQDEMYTTSQARRASATNTDKAGSFTLLNCKISHGVDLPCPGMDMTVYVAGENLTDADYEYQSGYPMPGISLMTGVVLSF